MRGLTIEKSNGEFHSGFTGTLDEIAVGLPAPTVTDPMVTTLTASGAKLSVLINSNGMPTTISIQYGKTTDYGMEATLKAVENQLHPVEILEELPNLEPATVYHYRWVTQGTAGIYFGPDETFTTPKQDTAPASP